MIMSQILYKQKNRKTEKGPKKIATAKARSKSFKKVRARHQMNAVYGSSSNSSKIRRCGECEGCMRDDCGKCSACADKPRFGGPGSKKKACMARSCRMRGQMQGPSPIPQDQAVTVNLQEAQTYQIMGYVGGQPVVQPIEAANATATYGFMQTN